MTTTNDRRRAELLAERQAATFAQVGGRDDAIRYLADGPLAPALEGTYQRAELWALAAEVIDERPEVLTLTRAQVEQADRERGDRIADLVARAGAAKAAGHLAECLALLRQAEQLDPDAPAARHRTTSHLRAQVEHAMAARAAGHQLAAPDGRNNA